MKVAVVGSRTLTPEIPETLIPKNTTLIISGAATGVDRAARAYALEHRIQILEIVPDYGKHGKAAPLRRNEQIVSQADYVLAFWNGKSRGTKFVIDRCRACGKPLKVVMMTEL